MPRSAQISIFGGGGGILKLKSQSAKICPNFYFFWGGGDSETEKSKHQDLPKFLFLGGYSETEKSKCQDRRGGYSETEKSKRQDLPKFLFLGGVF